MKSLRSLTPIRKTALIGIAVLLAMLVAGWQFVLSPRSEAVAAVNDEVSAASATNDSLRNTIAARRAQQAKLPELRKVAKALAGRFPASAEQKKMFEMITAAAGQAGLAPGAVSNLTVGPPIAGSGGQATSAQLPGVGAPTAEVYSQQITMNVHGTAEQVRDMVGNLEQLPRAFQVTSISLSNTVAAPASTTTTGSAPAAVPVDEQDVTITGDMFVMPVLTDPTLHLTPAKAKAKTSARSGSRTAAKSAAKKAS